MAAKSAVRRFILWTPNTTMVLLSCKSACLVESADTPESLASKVHQLEYELLPEAIRLFEENRIRIEGRRVFL